MLNKLLYSILFLKGRNGSDLKELSNLLQINDIEIVKLIQKLRHELKETDSPLEIKETENKIRLTIRKEIALELSEKMNKTINVGLTKSTIEALTIIAYKQPATKADIENVRGVSADYSISKLLEYELIEIAGVADLPGKPRLFKTTPLFLEVFDLNSLEDLPPIPKEFENKAHEKTEETPLFIYDNDENKELKEEIIEITKEEKIEL